MADNLTPKQRKHAMSQVKGKNTKPELKIRSMLHKLGYRFRIHNNNLPGKPDVILPCHKKIVFVHGCFWHGHECAKGKRPATREEFWNTKLDKNILRDDLNQEKLKTLGWNVLVIWQCELKQESLVLHKIKTFMSLQDG